ncbi:MAG: hypothetical protein K9G60_09055 [Pseudolabrys sp.]|nr:hypothetical protein [Pseudolabrys sp.]
MADWSIKIAKDPNGKIVYQAQLQPNNPVGTLYMAPGDSVSWNNQSGGERQPTLTDINGSPATPGGRGTALYLSDPIADGHSSRPSWIAPTSPVPGTYSYISKDYPAETGTIVVDNPPAATS